MCTDWMGADSNCYLGVCILSRDGQCSSANLPGSASLTKAEFPIGVKSRSCPTTNLCSRLHCRSSSDDRSCPQLWSNAPNDGSPCGDNGPLDSSRVCVS